jgi:hypothetical protein
MDPFNENTQIEEEGYFNLSEEDDFFLDEEFDDKSFNEYLNSTHDF